MLVINDGARFTSRRELGYPISAEQAFRSYSGVAILDFQGPFRDSVLLEPPEELPTTPGKVFVCDQWTLDVSLAAFSLNAHNFQDNLVALDNWRLWTPVISGAVWISADIVIQGRQNYLHRLAYHLVAIGHEEDPPIT